MRKLFEKRFKPIETVIVLALMAVLITTVANRYDTLALNAKINSVEMDLNNINLGIKLYRIKENRYPRQLYDLIHKNYIEINQLGQKAVGQSRVEKGTVLDVFGHSYEYDNVSGRVELNALTTAIINEVKLTVEK